MNPDQDSQNMENFQEEIEFDDSLSIDDFIKELEAKEANLKGINFNSYTAEYRFYKNKLSRLTITANTKTPSNL